MVRSWTWCPRLATHRVIQNGDELYFVLVVCLLNFSSPEAEESLASLGTLFHVATA